jgi:hypothetical protein
VDARVMTVSKQANIGIINQGRDQGVRIGMKFTIHRGDRFVASAIVREIYREFAAVEFVLLHGEPRVGDRASNRLLR